MKTTLAERFLTLIELKIIKGSWQGYLNPKKRSIILVEKTHLRRLRFYAEDPK